MPLNLKASPGDMKSPNHPREMNSSSIIFVRFLLWSYCILQPPGTTTSSPCLMEVGTKGHVCYGLEKCTADVECEKVCTTQGLPKDCLVCTAITTDFLFKETVEKAGGPEQFDPEDPKVKVCRPMHYNETIAMLLDKFVLPPRDPCHLTLQNRLLKYWHLNEAEDEKSPEKPGRYVNSLKDRLESLELIAMGNASNSRMCNIHEFSFCQEDNLRRGYGECFCFYGRNFDNETCKSNQYGRCDEEVAVFNEDIPMEYRRSPLTENKLHLPLNLTTPKHKFKCGLSRDANDADKLIQLECKAKECICPEGMTCGSASRDTLWEYIQDPKYLPDDGDITDFDNYVEALGLVQNKMTGEIGDACSEYGEKKLATELEFLREYAKYGAKAKGWRKEYLLHQTDNLVQLSNHVVKTLDVDGHPVAQHCIVKKNGTEILREEGNTGVAQRYKCEKDPLATDSWYCVVEEYNRDEAESIYSGLSQPQLHGKACDQESEKKLVEIINQGRAIYHKNPLVKDEVSDFRFRLMELMRNHSNESTEAGTGKKKPRAEKLCNNNGEKAQGLRCVKGKCECGNDFKWSEAKKNCLVKIGRSCRECKQMKPFLSCKNDHLCEDGAECRTPFGNEETSKQCIPETIPKPVTPKVKSIADTLISNSKLWVVSYFFLFFLTSHL